MKWLRWLQERFFSVPEESGCNHIYVDGTDQVVRNVHLVSMQCLEYGCCIHCPTDHRMKSWPTHWRDDRKLMERICPHGVGHPDPDHLNYLMRTVGEDEMRTESMHGCDGCCREKK